MNTLPAATSISRAAPAPRSRKRSTGTRLAAGAVGALSGMRSEVEARFRDQLERVLAGMDLVSREEFEAVKAMAAKARDEQEILRCRIEVLETRLAAVER